MAATLMPKGLNFKAHDEGVQEASVGFDRNLLFVPGMYCPSGFDLMKILFCVVSRPNPTIDLGPVDASCPIVLCDLYLPDQPVVYASASFLRLTGYSLDEVIGRNCRFLQWPSRPAQQPSWEGQQQQTFPQQSELSNSSVPSMQSSAYVRQQLHQAVKNNLEVQVELLNFRKDGTPFVNVLALVPIYWNEEGNGIALNGDHSRTVRRHRYSVGFLCDKAAMM
ncbi:hypothetical protein SEPCBS57363_002691 [Sporothrix epigloea]|uniref:PAS domain-containing protein n=1 Tax=Sporothrix epigloea TaxID=1892477 RepID=A0ABP0DIL4_9PEZI